MRNLDKYKGIIPAFYGCYDGSGGVSSERAKKLANFYVEKGVKGLYVGGSSGEAIYQTVNERKAVLDYVMDTVGGKVTIIAHIAAPSTRDSIELAIHARQAGADAIAAIPGVYYRLTEPMVERYWKDILDSADMDMIIYNIPQTTGFSMSLELFGRMLQTKQVIGVKNSSLQPDDIQRYKSLGGQDVIVFNGVDEQYIAGRVMGAEGGIGGTYGMMPELFIKLESLLRAGDFRTASELQFEINEVIHALHTFSCLYASAKAVLGFRGFDTGGVRPPFLPIENNQTDKIRIIYEKTMRLIHKYAV